MTYDTRVPAQLKSIQQWFGHIIGRPIDNNSRMNPISPSGQPMEIEAAGYIAPSPTLRPAQRIELYNQQYWWRLLNTMQEGFPLVTRLFGFYEFNQTIAVPYLVKYPPRHWSLSFLGDRLSQWAKEEYTGDDKSLIIDAIALDWAFNFSFIAPQLPSLSQNELQDNSSDLLQTPLYTQPHLHLFALDCNLLPFRAEFLKHPPDYWVENDFPQLTWHEQPQHYALFRTHTQDIVWKEIPSLEYQLLSLFQKGSSIEQLCAFVEAQDETISDLASQNLHLWFQEWTARRFLTPLQYTEQTSV